MTRWKKNLSNKIRNVKLVPESDEGFIDFVANIKLENYHLRPSNQRSYADLIAIPLEKTVREWAKVSGVTLDQRIISYEILTDNNRYERRYNEIDFILRLEDKLFLVEVKVSSSERAVPKASNQLINAREILGCSYTDIDVMIIHINLNYKNIEFEFHQFRENFMEMEFAKLGVGELQYRYIQLKPHQVFKWGVKKGIIFDAELLSKAIEESDYLHLIRTRRQELKEKEIPKDEWPDELTDKVKFEDNKKTYFMSFGISSSPTLLSEKLKNTLNSRGDEEVDKNAKRSI